MIVYALIYFDHKKVSFFLLWMLQKTLVLKAMTKVEINFCKCGLFLIFNVDYFLPFGLGKFNQNCFIDLQTIQFISYKSVNWFWLNLPYRYSKNSNVKNNAHWQMDLFCHFDFCHSRRNYLRFQITFHCVTITFVQIFLLKRKHFLYSDLIFLYIFLKFI